MDELNSFPRKMSNTKLKLSDLNPHLMCVLCGGYYIDATTIVECLHSFCRSCIVKHLESSKYCPICEVQVHKTKPLINIRPDKTLQDIVYKLVPGLFANEMRSRRKFYRERPHYIKPNNSESVGEVSGERKIYINDENITFSLVYDTGSVSGNVGEGYEEISAPVQNEKKYFKCPTGVTIYHLKKLLKTKYELNDSNYKLEVYLKDQTLHEDLTLLDVSYIYTWKSKGNLDLTYKIFENLVKRQKIDRKEVKNKITAVEPMEKESEESSQSIEIPPKKNLPENVESQEEIPAAKAQVQVKGEEPAAEEEAKRKAASESAAEASFPVPETVATVGGINASEPLGPIKENGVVKGGESKEVQLQISESGVMSVSQVEDGGEIVRTMEDGPPKAVDNQSITGLSLGPDKDRVKGNGEGVKPEGMNNRVAGESQRKANSKPAKPYKTIRCSPKTWHPVIPKEKLRPTLMKNSDEPKKPLKFFKMRNMPRFLGNPSSGVKPMYAEPPETKVDGEKKPQEKKAETTKNKILKIDPKTLRPIDQKEEIKLTKTPNVPNLLTNPFIPNNNHFLFSDLHLLPPNSGNFSNSKSDSKAGDKPPVAAAPAPAPAAPGGFKTVLPNGGYPPICFPSPDHNPGFYPFSNLSKHQNFPFPVGDKMDPLLRASRLSPFANLTGFNVAGFHASLPPSISRLLNPHHHFRKINQSLEKKNKEESTNETTKSHSCDGGATAIRPSEEGKEDEDEEKEKKEEAKQTIQTVKDKSKFRWKEETEPEETKKKKKEEEEREEEGMEKVEERKESKEEKMEEDDKETRKNEKENGEVKGGEDKGNKSASKPEVKSEESISENNAAIDRDKKEKL